MSDQFQDRMARRSDLADGGLRGITGPLAKVSHGDVQSNWTVASGTGTATLGRAESQDGGAGQLNLSTVAAGRPNGISYYSAINCTGVGIRGRRSSASTQPPVALIVNGRCVLAVPSTKSLTQGINFGSYTDQERAAYEFPFRLKRMLHSVGVRVDGNGDGTTINSWAFSGYTLPRADGFRDTPPPPRKGYIEAAAVVTTAFAAITNGGLLDRAVRAFSFQNTDTVDRTVTINCATPSGGVSVYAILTIPTGSGSGTKDRVRFVLPQPYSMQGWQIKADANSVVFYWTENA